MREGQLGAFPTPRREEPPPALLFAPFPRFFCGSLRHAPGNYAVLGAELEVIFARQLRALAPHRWPPSWRAPGRSRRAVTGAGTPCTPSRLPRTRAEEPDCTARLAGLHLWDDLDKPSQGREGARLSRWPLGATPRTQSSGLRHLFSFSGNLPGEVRVLQARSSKFSYLDTLSLPPTPVPHFSLRTSWRAAWRW